VRLPDFLGNTTLNDLRQQMGATTLGDITLALGEDRLTIAELEMLMTGGIDIENLDEVVVLADRTLAYKGARVLLYIRDVNDYGRRGSGIEALPRFHVSNCKKLQEMRAQQRYFRYVVAARNDGSFQINLIRDGAIQTSVEQLRVCQYCLGELPYDNFSHEWPRARRLEVVAAFTVQRYFELYPRDLVTGDGLGDEATAPLNDYTGDFGKYATEVKRAAHWRCKQCRRVLEEPQMRKFLHAHHINGVKYDNSPANLACLCIDCHSKQPGHSHMGSLPELAVYRALFGLT
jgi:hypothetical protein